MMRPSPFKKNGGTNREWTQMNAKQRSGPRGSKRVCSPCARRRRRPRPRVRKRTTRLRARGRGRAQRVHAALQMTGSAAVIRVHSRAFAVQKLSSNCQIYIFPKASMSSHILRTSSGLPVISGSSLTRSSQGKQTPGRTRGCGLASHALELLAIGYRGRHFAGRGGDGRLVSCPRHRRRAARAVSVITRRFSMLVSSCMMAPASMM